MNNKPYNQKQNKMKNQKPFNIERVREFCKLVNNGLKPKEALAKMNTCEGYQMPLKKAGLFWKEKDGSYKAVERIRTDRYELFVNEKKNYNKYKNKKQYKQFAKQPTLFNQPKPKQTTATTMKAKQPQLNFIQRVVKSIFNL
jgi:hypothetical protein